MSSSQPSAVLLAFDIGNTNTKIGAFRGQDLLTQWRLKTDPERTADEYAALLGVLMSHEGLSLENVSGVSLSSTVPALVPVLRAFGQRYLGSHRPFLEISSKAHLPISIAIERPSEMGADRIADALAVRCLYRLPAIVVDFGTATTFDAVDADARLLGTAIAPGFRTAMDGLLNRAARLTRVEVARPPAAIGRSTVDALRSGWLYGYVGLVEGLVRRIDDELGGNALVVATGGLAEEVVAETNVVHVHDPYLTLKGLRIFYEMNGPDSPVEVP